MGLCKVKDIPMTHEQYQRDKIKELREEVRMWRGLCGLCWVCWVMFEAAFIYLVR